MRLILFNILRVSLLNNKLYFISFCVSRARYRKKQARNATFIALREKLDYIYAEKNIKKFIGYCLLLVHMYYVRRGVVMECMVMCLFLGYNISHWLAHVNVVCRMFIRPYKWFVESNAYCKHISIHEVLMLYHDTWNLCMVFVTTDIMSSHLLHKRMNHICIELKPIGMLTYILFSDLI